MSLFKSKLVKRFGVGIPAVLLIIALLEYTSPAMIKTIAGLVMALALYEYAGVTGERSPRERSFRRIVLVPLGTLLYFILTFGNPDTNMDWFAGFSLIAMLIAMARGAEFKETALLSGVFILGFFWIPVLGSYIARIVDLHSGMDAIYLALILSFAGDSFALFTGKILGGTWWKIPPTPHLSPNKTMEGFIGGIFFDVIAMLVANMIWSNLGLGVFHAIALGVSGALFGIAGDLFESGIKRSYNADDAGSILPGHGGFLDRLDSLNPISWWTFTYLTVFIGLV